MGLLVIKQQAEQKPYFKTGIFFLHDVTLTVDRQGWKVRRLLPQMWL